MPSANLAEKIRPSELERLHDDVREGHACMATFAGPRGLSLVEIMGPMGMRPDGDYLKAPVPTLRLWVPEQGRTDVVAAANGDFDAGLRAIEVAARPHLFDAEVVNLTAVLRVVRDATRVSRPRVPHVGTRLTQEGRPSLRAWASCLTLGDLEVAVLKAVA
jgi:hypothetical protein